MGMSIEEAIPILHDMYNYYNDVDVDAFVGFDNDDNNAIETALDTMRKYQKIQEIVTKWKNESKMVFDTNYYNMAKIIEVVKDGKID